MSNPNSNQQTADNRDDDVLIQSFLNGNESAFEALVHRYSKEIYRAVYAFLGSKQDSEEIVQDAFLRAYRGLKFFRGDAAFRTWLYRIALNLARNRYQLNRRRGADRTVSLDTPADENMDDSAGTSSVIDIPDTHSEPSDSMQRKELERGILSGLSDLPDGLREVMVLRHLDNMPYEEIAARLDCKLGTVKSRLSRGRELLREKLSGSGVI